MENYVEKWCTTCGNTITEAQMQHCEVSLEPGKELCPVCYFFEQDKAPKANKKRRKHQPN